MAIQLYERQVAAKPLPGLSLARVQPNTAADQGLEQLGVGIQRGSAGIGEYVARRDAESEREQARQDAIRVNVASEELLQQKEQLLQDQSSGFLATQKGQSAIKQAQSYKDQFDNIVKLQAQQLTPRQQEMFRAAGIHESTSFSNIVNLHVKKETDSLAEQTSQSLLANKAREASASALTGDHAGTEEAVSAGLGHIDQLAQVNGWTPEVKADKIAQYTSGTRIGVLENVLGAGQVDRAQELFKQWAPSLNASDMQRTKLQERIDGAVVGARADELAQTAWAASGNDVDKAMAWVSEAHATNAALPEGTGAPGVKDPRILDLAMAAVKKQDDQYQAGLQKLDGQGLARLGEAISRGQGGFSITDLDNNPDMIRMNKQENKTKAVQMVFAEIRKASDDANARRVQAEIDALAMSDFRRRKYNDRDDAIRVDPRTEYPTATQKTINDITAEQGKVKEDASSDNAITDSEYARWVNRQTRDIANKPEREWTQNKLLEWHEDQKLQSNGKPPTREAAQKHLEDMLVTKGTVPGFIFDSTSTQAHAIFKGEGDSWIPPKPNQLPAAPAPKPKIEKKPAPATAAQTRTDPTTGETRVWNGKVWVKQ